MTAEATTSKGTVLARSLKEAEMQYSSAKVSVWWDIENCPVSRGCDAHSIAKNISSALVRMNYCGPVSISAYGDTKRIPSSVQHALSSTGISLNHVPAGVKDASDKKILVDMLFWAVDNPAPANYLLISGDRDFSNALHQLRMRRYNILLAQPLKASVSLTAAARSVWLWTSLSAGGPPLSSGSSSNIASNTQSFSSETVQNRVSEPSQPRFKEKYTNCDASQFPESKTKNNHCSNPELPQAKLFPRAPHEFFCNKPNIATISSALSLPSHQDHSKSSGSNSSGGIPHDSQNSFLRQNNLHDHQESRQDYRISTSQSPNVVSLTTSTEHNPHASQASCYENVDKGSSRNCEQSNTSLSSFIPNTSSSDIWGAKFLRPPSEYDQHLIGCILLTLDTLKTEKVMPTHGNISDCIRYGDVRYQTIDARKALDCAIEHGMVVKQSIGSLNFYVNKNGKLWKCVNPIGGYPNDFSDATWARIQQFLSSPTGKSSILASRCRYEASLILRRSCMEKEVLGDVLKILEMIISVKKWIIHNHSGEWQPITITLEQS
ncbi:hypothetical protein HN51_014835 [Arachis hypogaea]|uniref:Uncharacterized protein LOC107492278 n=1 Tax=Arachis duranensis TaxID=130453 RepID=A0A6P4DID6_ARADU|nr:uncharacterized protein LOC107492278 [Arachis duranensis]XP_025603896.1 uncharacterized protein LOC112695676 [Arachis hypogaea]XP_057719202.1 uncharacterized protein LOC130933593 [Arachis stenosperma]QHO45147.1 uncharacterized protein DS421_6g176590 [Arachis hypogaea]